MSEVDDLAAAGLAAFVKEHCTHGSQECDPLARSMLVCRHCAIDWATTGAFACVMLEREECAKLAESEAKAMFAGCKRGELLDEADDALKAFAKKIRARGDA